MRMRALILGLALLPGVAGAQAKPAEKKPVAKPAMPHDMHTMGGDSTMKHGMPGMAMGKGQAMGEMKSGWKELDAFHTLLMSVWHPALKDSLAMARTLAPTLATSAAAWEKSKGPAACDNADARKALPAIIADAKAYAGVVAGKADDAAVKAALKKVHDGFEKVAMPCMMASMKGKGGMGMGMGTGKGMGMGMGMDMKSGWKEFDALHTEFMTLSQASMKGDLKAVRDQAPALGMAADAWLASKGPATCDNAAARKGMPGAVADLKAIAAAGKESDDALKAAVTKAHDSFRSIAQPCMMAHMKDMPARDSMKQAMPGMKKPMDGMKKP